MLIGSLSGPASSVLPSPFFVLRSVAWPQCGLRLVHSISKICILACVFPNLVFFLSMMDVLNLHEVPDDDDGPVFHVDGTRRYRWDHFLGSAARQISGPGAAPRRELTQLVFRTPNPDVVGTVYSLYLCCIVDPVGFCRIHFLLV